MSLIASPGTRAFKLQLAAVFCFALIASRVLLAPRYLYHFDSVNFALALDVFNPALHQPQPPGYPWFVGLLRVVHLFLVNPQHTQIAAGLLVSAGCLGLMYLLGRDVFGSRTGVFAVLALIFNPPFWFGGLTNQVRLMLAVSATAVMLLAWHSRQGSRKAFLGSFAALGAAAGFRPASAFLLLPLALWGAFGARRKGQDWLIALFLYGGLGLAAFFTAAVPAGGPIEYLKLLDQYSQVQFSGSSLLFGAGSAGAWKMSLSALIWNGLALVCWIWAVPFAGRALSLDRDRAALLVFALAPALIFQLFVHVGDPDQVLLSIPAWCLLGGYVVDMVAQRRDNTGVVATILVAVNMLLFLRPLPDVAGKSNARQVRGVDRMMNATFDRLREVTTRRPTCIVFVSNYVSWRHISYYFPDVPLYVLTGDPAAPRQAEPAAYLLEGRSGQQLPVDGNQIILPEGRDLLFLVPENHPAWRAAAAQLPIDRSGAYPVVPAGSVERLSIGSYHFRVGGPGSGRIRQVVDGM